MTRRLDGNLPPLPLPIRPNMPLLLLLPFSHLTPLPGLPLLLLHWLLCYGGEEGRGGGRGEKRSYGALGILLLFLPSGQVGLKSSLGVGNLGNRRLKL